MIEFRGVALEGDLGERKFVLRNGEETKTFYNAGEFNFTIGQFPIYNENNEIVEYMDLMGNFTKGHTQLACSLYGYILAESYYPQCVFGYLYGLSNFPSKHYVDPKVREFIVNEEKERMKLLKLGGASLLTRLRYKYLISRCFKIKFARADKYANQQNKEMVIDETEKLF